jgi:hypothetical protein
MMSDTIEYVESAQGHSLPAKDNGRDYHFDIISLHLYDMMAEELMKTGKLQDALNLPLQEIDRVDWAALEKKKLLRLKELLAERTQVTEPPKSLVDVSFVLNISMMIRIIFADVASIIRAFLKAESEIEHALTLRRLVISKVSVLGHLIGYNEAEKQNALWDTIISAIPSGEVALMGEACAIRQDLEALIKQEDVEKRALYVHLMDRYTHESNVPRIIESLKGVDLMSELHVLTGLINVLGSIKKFLTPLITAIAKVEDKKAKETDAMIRSQIKDFRRLTSNPKITPELRNNINTSMDQLETIMDLFKKL